MTYARHLLSAHNPAAIAGPTRGFFAWLIWAIFGNADDGPSGPADFQPSRSDWQRRILWWLRNPAHNLMFYVLGCAHLDQVREGRYPLSVFAPNGGFNWAISRVNFDLQRAYINLVCLAVWIFGLFFLFLGAWSLLWLSVIAFYLLCVFHDFGWMPFISYQGCGIKAYIGWRERGNFGIKFNLVRTPE